MVYGDASEIVTELTTGSTNDQLRVSSGGLPEWFTPSSPASQYYEHIATGSGTSVTTLTVSFTAVTNPDYIIAVYNGSVTSGQGNDLQVNGITSATYDQNGIEVQGGSVTGFSPSSQVRWYGYLSAVAGQGGIVTAEIHTDGDNLYSFIKNSTDKAGFMSSAGFNSTVGQTSISSVTFLGGSSFTGQVDIWKVSV
jgi:hypothetical protein